MADKWAVANGNWSAGATWNGGTVPQAGDNVYANGKAVTVDAGLTTPVVGRLSTEANAGLGVAAGGSFSARDGCTIQATNIVAGGSHCVLVNDSISFSVLAATVTGSATAQAAGVYMQSSGTCTATVGAVYGGAYNNINSSGFHVSSGTLVFTGDAVGSSTNSSACGIQITSATGHVITGTAKGGAGGAPGVQNGAGGQVQISTAQSNNYPNDGVTTGGVGSNQLNNSGSVLLDAMVFGSGGWHPVAGRHFVRDAGTNFVQMRQANNGAVTTIGDVPNDYPAPSDVRSGVSYDFGAKTGTCAVPPAGSVALGVPVDATVGTAALSPTALLGADLKARLENCSTVQTIGDQLAALM